MLRLTLINCVDIKTQTFVHKYTQLTPLIDGEVMYGCNVMLLKETYVHLSLGIKTGQIVPKRLSLSL